MASTIRSVGQNLSFPVKNGPWPVASISSSLKLQKVCIRAVFVATENPTDLSKALIIMMCEKPFYLSSSCDSR
jgi:hypothetical protein